jgi:hypothetical protein
MRLFPEGSQLTVIEWKGDDYFVVIKDPCSKTGLEFGEYRLFVSTLRPEAIFTEISCLIGYQCAGSGTQEELAFTVLRPVPVVSELVSDRVPQEGQLLYFEASNTWGWREPSEEYPRYIPCADATKRFEYDFYTGVDLSRLRCV